jgi:hypothetical protein
VLVIAALAIGLGVGLSDSGGDDDDNNNSPQGLSMAPSNLAVTCSDLTTQELYNSCAEACAPASCCNLEDPNSCFNENSVACSSYQPCVALSDGHNMVSLLFVQYIHKGPPT